MDNKLPVALPKQPKRSVPCCCALRENGFYGKCNGPPKYLQWAAEDKLVARNHEEFGCKLPDTTRSVFLMVFSPDGKRIASTHGNHNVYVTDLTDGKNVMTLTGHPRTPWCIAFHPSSNQILASGCLGGQVRVWDLHGGSEIWTAESHTVIASLAFHPVDRVLVIASYNELHFWDWSQQKPFAKCSTENEKEKVRYIAFDQLGHKLITGIANAPHAHSQWDRVSAPQPPPQAPQMEHERRITICYRYMVEQYEQLVQRYFDISRRGALAATTTDRGTDPMDHDEDSRRGAGNSSSRDDGMIPGPSRDTRRSRHSSTSGTDEISASHSSSQFLSHCLFPHQGDRPTNGSIETPPRTQDTGGPSGQLRSHYRRVIAPPRPEETSPQSDRLWERLNHLRAQVESGRQILATARSATAAITARMSPSAPEDANYLIENLLPAEWTDIGPRGSRGSSSSSSLAPGSDFQNSQSGMESNHSRTMRRETNALPLLMDLSRSSEVPRRPDHLSTDNFYTSGLVPPLQPPPPPSPPPPPPPPPHHHSRPDLSRENPFLKRVQALSRLSRNGSLSDAQDLRTINNQEPPEPGPSGGRSFSVPAPNLRTPRNSAHPPLGSLTAIELGIMALDMTAEQEIRLWESFLGRRMLSHEVERIERSKRVSRQQRSDGTQSRSNTDEPSEQNGGSQSRNLTSPPPNPRESSGRRSAGEAELAGRAGVSGQSLDQPHSSGTSARRHSVGADSSTPSSSTCNTPLSERVLRGVSNKMLIVRLSVELKRLRNAYEQGENEPAHLNEDANAAERRLFVRLTNPLNRLYSIQNSELSVSNRSAFQPPSTTIAGLGSMPDLIHFGIQFLSRHIDEIFKLCRVRMDNMQLQQMRKVWEDLQSQIFALHGVVTVEPIPIPEDLSMRGGRGTAGGRESGAGTSSESGPSESGASTEPTSSLNTDDDSDGEGSSSGLTMAGPSPRRQLFSFRQRFRFLQRTPRASAAKRARYESAVRAAERLNRSYRPVTRIQANRDSTSGQTTGTDEGSDGEGGSRGDLSRPESQTASTSQGGERGPCRRKERLQFSHLNQSSENGGRVNRLIVQPGPSRGRLHHPRCIGRYRVNFSQQPRVWHRWSQPSQSARDFSSQTPPFTQDAAVGTSSESPRPNPWLRDCLRRRTRNVLMVMVDSLTEFFENDAINRRISTEMLQDRINSLHSLLQLALGLTELLLSQPESSRSEIDQRAAKYRALRFQREGYRRFLRRSLGALSERTASGPSRRSHSLLSGSVRPHRVPILRVNDGPVPSETPPPLPRDPGDRRDPPVYPASSLITTHWRPRFLHPRFVGPNPFEESTEDSSSIERENLIFMRGNGPTSVVLTDTPTAPHHRIQAWDFSKYQLPEIHNATKNIVVSECKIHNDASVDLSSDGTLLVTLLPSGRLSITTMLGIYSLKWETLGQCLYTTSFEQNAVSVSLSPTTRHLIVGLASKRLNMFSIDRHTIAQVLKLEGGRPGQVSGVPSKGRLVFVRDVELDRDIEFMSLNCIRWIPTPGAGFVYGTNTGLLKILR